MRTARCRRWLGLVALAVVLFGVGQGASAQTWRIDPAFTVDSTFTNNVNLSAERKSDWVNTLTPSVHFTEAGAHSRIVGNISVPVLLYLRTPHENNYVAPSANIVGTVEAVDRLLYVDALIDVSQRFLSPFAAHPTDLASATENRYTSQAYRISPYLKVSARDDVDYELRQSSLWTDANATGIATGRAYTNEVSGHVTRQPKPFGWSVEFDRSDVDFITHQAGVIYGAGLRWRPSERTSLDASWEHRFFGSSYHVVASHRTPLTVWSVRASRDITTYPQQLAEFPVGVDIPNLLNALFQSKFPDPIQRQAAVDQVIRDRGLPVTLTTPIAVFSEQVTLLESQAANVGLIGARNSVFFTVYRSRNQPVEPEGVADLAPLLAQLLDETQIGANVAWTHQLAPTMSLTTEADWSRATSNAQQNALTRQYSLRAAVSASLTALTSVYGGVRYQNLRSDVASSFNEFAVFVGLTHTFH